MKIPRQVGMLVTTLFCAKQLIQMMIGANYNEANGASSKKDFRNKIFICKKESKETKYWLRLLAKTEEELRGECKNLWKEA